MLQSTNESPSSSASTRVEFEGSFSSSSSSSVPWQHPTLKTVFTTFILPMSMLLAQIAFVVIIMMFPRSPWPPMHMMQPMPCVFAFRTTANTMIRMGGNHRWIKKRSICRISSSGENSVELDPKMWPRRSHGDSISTLHCSPPRICGHDICISSICSGWRSVMGGHTRRNKIGHHRQPHQSQQHLAVTFLAGTSSSQDGNRRGGTSTSSIINTTSPDKDIVLTTTPSRRKAKRGQVVTIDVSLRGEDDYVPDPLFDSHGIVTFILGGGNYLPGLHSLIEEKMYETQSLYNISIDAGWGERNPNLVATMSKESFGEMVTQIKVGSELILQSGHKCYVTEITNTGDFIVDCNPPLAGASYSCNVKLLKVEKGPIDLDGAYAKQKKQVDDGVEGKDDLRKEKVKGRGGYIKEVEGGQTSRYEVATFGLGCFWGGELAYMREPGVVGTQVGYSQGHVDEPTYEQVCTGKTGHAEVIRVVFDPQIVSYRQLVELAMERLGDSIYTLNQVGNDKGTQYRSGLYYHSEAQRDVARKVLEWYDNEWCEGLQPKEVNRCVVVQVEKASENFWPAEEYHQQYLLKGGQSARKGATEDIRCYG